MMNRESPAIFDKKSMSKNFNSAAPGYDDVAVLQKYTGKELLDRLQLVRLSPGTVLDIGSGVGGMAEDLSSMYRKSRIIQVDIAENMLRRSMEREKAHHKKFSYLCADAELLPLKKGSADLVCSNLMMQWCDELPKLFSSVYDVLSEGGLFMFSSLGPDTLKELRESWEIVDSTPHVSPFCDMHVIGDALMSSGFSEPVIEVDNVVMSYEYISELMKDLKQLGAGNVNNQRRKTLTGKGRLKSMCEEYEKKRSAGKLPSTYEVIYGHAWSPGIQKENKKGVFSISLDSLKASLRRAAKKNNSTYGQ
jgi:malonyl-CoA O-methyltransferase